MMVYYINYIDKVIGSEVIQSLGISDREPSRHLLFSSACLIYFVFGVLH